MARVPHLLLCSRPDIVALFRPVGVVEPWGWLGCQIDDTLEMGHVGHWTGHGGAVGEEAVGGYSIRRFDDRRDLWLGL